MLIRSIHPLIKTKSASSRKQRNSLNTTYKTTKTMGMLTIYLDKITNLANADLFTASDPYVRFELEQDNWVSCSSRWHDVANRTFSSANLVILSLVHYLKYRYRSRTLIMDSKSPAPKTRIWILSMAKPFILLSQHWITWSWNAKSEMKMLEVVMTNWDGAKSNWKN